MKTYKEFVKLFEVYPGKVMFRRDYRNEFEQIFELKHQNEQFRRIDLLMKKMRKDVKDRVLPKNVLIFTEYKLKEWSETPDRKKIIQRSILNHLK